MADRSVTTEKWLFGAVFAGLCVALILINMLPLSVLPGRLPGPDLMVGLTLAWVLRRPHYLPALLVAAVFVFSDIMLMQPMGLWAAIVVIAVEYLRARAHQTREQTFLTEWLMVAILLLVMTLANRLVLSVFVVAQPNWGLVVVQYMSTVFAYPAIVFVSHLVFGITKMSAAEAEAKVRGS